MYGPGMENGPIYAFSGKWCEKLTERFEPWPIHMVLSLWNG
jgi:hypothetical protein